MRVALAGGVARRPASRTGWIGPAWLTCESPGGYPGALTGRGDLAR